MAESRRGHYLRVDNGVHRYENVGGSRVRHMRFVFDSGEKTRRYALHDDS